MSDQPASSGPAAGLQFDTAEHSHGAFSGLGCTVCRRPIRDAYFQANGQTVCAPCRAQLESPPAGNFLMAAAYGAGAGLLCAVIAGILLWKWNLFIAAAIVGYFVGRAVMRGSGSFGGTRYQALALLLTYLATAAMFVPAAVAGGDATIAGPVLWVATFMGALMFPLYIISSPFTLLVIGLSLWEAWRTTARVQFAFTGPHPVAPQAESEAPAFA